MKPTKNKYFCVDAGRPKMLFETEGSANRFIQFNSEIILKEEGKAPVRSYYCISCGGWHVTSKPDVPIKKSKVERYFDGRLSSDEEAEKLVKKLIDCLTRILTKSEGKIEFLSLCSTFRKYKNDRRIYHYIPFIDVLERDSALLSLSIIDKCTESLRDLPSSYCLSRNIYKRIKEQTKNPGN